MREWVTIDVADALELLSPDFRNPEVGGGVLVVVWRGVGGTGRGG